MSWFTEEPWYPLLGCVLALLALGGLWRTTPNPVYLKAMAGVVFAAVVVIVVERAIVTEAERIDEGVRDMVAAFRRQDVDRTLSHISAAATAARALVSNAIGIVDIHDDLRITVIQVNVADGRERATARFRVNGTAEARGTSRHVSTRWELNFEREGGRWKVTRIQRMRLTKDEFIDPLNMSEL